MEHPWRDEERLRELYWKKGMSLSEIADQMDTGSTTIHRWMKKYDIPTETPPQDMPAHFRTEERGYEVWRVDNGEKQHKVRVHRLAAVAEYGFDKVVEEDDIHHRNSIPWDNRPENLQPIDKTKHGLLHGNP